MGKNNDLPDKNITNAKPWHDVDDFASQLQYKLKIALEEVKKSQERQKEITKKNYDRKNNVKKDNYQIGHKVLIKNNSTNKFDSLYNGPYTIIDLDDFNVYVKIKNTTKKINKNNIKTFYSN